MRKIHKRRNEEIYQRVIIISCLFLISIVIGSFMNKILSLTQTDILSLIEPIQNYYQSEIDIKQFVVSNLKENVILISSMMILTILIVTFPLTVLIFLLKALSIGYTINSCIIGMKLLSLKSILVIIFKNIVIIPVSIIVMMISYNHFKECLIELKKNNKEKILSYTKRYVVSMIMILIVSSIVQAIINVVGISAIQFLIR